MKEQVLVLGATPNPARYSYKATIMLQQHGHRVVAFGIRKGKIGAVEITSKLPENGIDTVTLYVGPERQTDYYEYLLKLKPKRILFNPGTENQELVNLAQKQGIECEEACTLVLLSTGVF